jgi:hypothetical protein
MEKSMYDAREEIKRADHLIYVSLKYTRTVDVIKNIIQRLINCYDFGINVVMIKLKEEGKLSEIPVSPGLRCSVVLQHYPEHAEMKQHIEFYLFLRKINRAKFTRFQEFRRNVTMTAIMEDGENVEVNIDIITEYFEKTQKFIELLEALLKND